MTIESSWEDRLATVQWHTPTVEWPADAYEARCRLLDALGDVLFESHPTRPDSLAAALELTGDPLFEIGRSAIDNTIRLLRTPCRWDQIDVVARVCNDGHVALRSAYQRALVGRTLEGRAQ